MGGRSLLVLDPADNVAVALADLTPGAAGELPVHEPVARGHKVARRDLAPGEAVIKCGQLIGIATRSIPAGSHVHIHNVSELPGGHPVSVRSRREPDPGAAPTAPEAGRTRSTRRCRAERATCPGSSESSRPLPRRDAEGGEGAGVLKRAAGVRHRREVEVVPLHPRHHIGVGRLRHLLASARGDAEGGE